MAALFLFSCSGCVRAIITRAHNQILTFFLTMLGIARLGVIGCTLAVCAYKMFLLHINHLPILRYHTTLSTVVLTIWGCGGIGIRATFRS